MTIRSPVLKHIGASAFIFAAVIPTQHALAWGHSGHVFIGEVAGATLPTEIPGIVRGSPDLGDLSAEADVSKSSGDASTPNNDVHDAERDPGHYIDLDDAGYVSPAVDYPHVPALQLHSLLAPNQGRRDFDTLLRSNTPSSLPFQQTQYTGYLPYNMTDLWQQIRKDFAYLRAFRAAVRNPATPDADRAYFDNLLRLRRNLVIRDIGYWGHFVGDASQPMHVSIHYNGWGNYPNPHNFTTQPIHAPFEGYFVKTFVTKAEVLAAVGPYRSCEEVTGLSSCPGIEPRIRVYLQQTLDSVKPLYTLTKRLGGTSDNTVNPWTTTAPTNEQKAFVVARLAAAAQEMRDEIVDAWHSAETINVGYPLIKISDIESGAVVLTAEKYASD